MKISINSDYWFVSHLIVWKFEFTLFDILQPPLLCCDNVKWNFPFPNRQNFPFQTVEISLSKLSKFPFPNCQNFPFCTVISIAGNVDFHRILPSLNMRKKNLNNARKSLLVHLRNWKEENERGDLFSALPLFLKDFLDYICSILCHLRLYNETIY